MTKRNATATQRGAALVEFAIVLPLLLTLLMGIAEFGLLFYNKQVVTNASREGARAGIIQPNAGEDPADISQIVDNYCQERLITFGAPTNVITTTSGEGGAYGEDLTVRVTYNYAFLVPGLLGFGTSMQIVGETVMKMEEVPTES